MSSVVNEQITDAVTQSNVKVVAEAPAMAMGNVYQTLAHSIGILMENAVNQQQQIQPYYKHKTYHLLQLSVPLHHFLPV